MSNDPNDLLMKGGTPWAAFPSAGTTVEGVLTEVSTRQARDYESGDLLEWKDGSPRMEVAITLATDLRSDDIEDDDGTRLLVLNSVEKKNAVRAAVKKAGAKGLEVGAYLAMTYTQDAPKVAGQKFRAKEYTATYALGAAALGTVEPTNDSEAPF